MQGELPLGAPAQSLPLSPNANRGIFLGEQYVAYELHRVRRRSIGFVISAEGLSVRAPRWVGQSEIEAGLREKSAWILRKLLQQTQRNAQRSQWQWCWREGARLPFLGREIELRLDARITGAQLQSESAKAQLWLGLGTNANAAQIRDLTKAWLMRQARRIFEERLDIFAPRLDVRWNALRLSSAHSRWGSANINGLICLNWRLVHYALPVIDYVVAHELAHLREMNHSPHFWRLVGSLIPDFKTQRQALRDDALPPLWAQADGEA